MVNTPNGPCYFCCCKGGSCNHPQIFAREASKLPINQHQAAPYNPYGNGGHRPSQNYYPMGWYTGTAAQTNNPFFLVAVILIIFLVLCHSVQ
uniref:Uncharacterized protein n=1 Tax=Caenorhabditis japonica TaxID=281687 RepID=A0A2Q4RCM4_CAEJA